MPMICPLASEVARHGKLSAVLRANLLDLNKLDTRGVSSFRSNLTTVLESFSRRSGIPFTVIDDATVPYRGKYVNINGEKRVVINLAYATKDTPFHEYLHPFVSLLKKRNKAFYDELLTRFEVTDEEALVEALGKEAVKRTSLYQRFLRFIRQIIDMITGRPSTIETIDSLGDLFYVLSGDLSFLSEENEIEEAFQLVQPKVDYIEKLKELSAQQALKTDDTKTTYDTHLGNDTAVRVTHFVSRDIFGFTPYGDDYAKNLARKEFASRGIKHPTDTSTITFQGELYTLERLTEHFDKRLKNAQAYGKMIHAYVQTLSGVAEAKVTGDNWAKAIDPTGITGMNMFDVLQQNWSLIKRSLNIHDKDKILTEASFMSKQLRDTEGKLIGTTIDFIVQHRSSAVSIIDWKTGKRALEDDASSIIKWAKERMIKTSRLNRYKLEVLLRAFILKEHFPDIVFRDLRVVNIKKSGAVEISDVEIVELLEVIERYVKETHPEDVYRYFADNGFFDARTYVTPAQILERYFEADEMGKMSTEAKEQYLQHRLAYLHTRYDEESINKNPYIRKEIELLTKALLELKTDTPKDLRVKAEDISALRGQFLSFTDVQHPYVQTFGKILFEAKTRHERRMQEIMREHDEKLHALLQEKLGKFYRFRRAPSLILFTTGILTLNPALVLSGIAYRMSLNRLGASVKDIYGFMWVETEDGYFANMSDEHEGRPLTKAEKEYRDFYHRVMRELYEEVMNEEFIVEQGAIKTRATLQGFSPSLPSGFMPRIPPTFEEVRQREGFLQNMLGLKTWVQHMFHKHFLDFSWDDHQQELPLGVLPVKYFHHVESPLVESKAHSLDAARAFTLFMNNLSYKKEFDTVLSVAYGLRALLSSPDLERYPELVKWLDKQISLQITQKTIDRDKPIRLIPTKTVAKILGVAPDRPIEISINKLLLLARSGISHMVMGFRLIGAIRNGVLITLTNMSQVSVGVIRKALGHVIHIDDDELRSISARAARSSVVDLLAYYRDLLLGNQEKNKLWLLAKYLRFLPENPIDPSVTTSAPFVFHQLVETYGSLMHLSMLLRSTVLTNEKGETFTAYDAYEVINGKITWTKGERGKIKRADGNFDTLTELSENEIKALRRANEILHGSYRQEELAAIEATVVGSFLFQFKRYFYRYLKNNFSLVVNDKYLGSYRVLERKPNETLLEWEGRTSEGRVLVLAKSLQALATNGRSGLRQYLTDKKRGDKSDRLIRLAEMLNIAFWAIGMYMLYSAVYDDDDDKKDLTRRHFTYLLRDLPQGLHPYDLFDVMQTPIIALSRANAYGKSVWTLLTEGVIGQRRTQRGDVYGLHRALIQTPYIGPSYQLMMALDETRLSRY